MLEASHGEYSSAESTSRINGGGEMSMVETR
jgi:hypothetical protein